MREARVSSERSDFEGPSSLFGYSESECQELVHVIRLGREVTLPLIDPGRISEVKWRNPLGDGAYCTTYEAELLLREEEEEEEEIEESERSSGGSRWRRRRQKKTVALRIVKAERRSEVLKEFKMIVSIPRAAVEVYGVTYVAESMLASGGEERGNKPPSFFVCMVLEFCPYGSMDDFFRCHNNSIPLATRVDVLLGALGGLKQLKANSIIWRDMKGQNMLVRRYEEETERNFGDASAIEGEGGRKGCQIGGRSQEGGKKIIKKVDFCFCDWGTAVSLESDQRRRMTLNGPGTNGYIAPETKSAKYSYQADMFAFLVWACSLCVDVDRGVGEGELEYQIGTLKLNSNFSRSKDAEEKKVKKLLGNFKDKGLIRSECIPLYDFLVNGCNWTQPEQRWTCEQAFDNIAEKFQRGGPEVEGRTSGLASRIQAPAGKESAERPRTEESKSKKGEARQVLRATRRRRPLQCVNVM